MSLLFAGTVALDHIITPTDRGENLLGGSACFAALAASRFLQPVHLIGIIGEDFPQPHLDRLERQGIETQGVERSSGGSFTWTGEYHDDMNSRSTHAVALNVLENWQPKVPAAAQTARFIGLANMSPDNQFAVLEQCTAAEKFVVADTMDLWLSITRPRLLELLREIDLLVLNEGEAKDLAETGNIVKAGAKIRALGPRFVIIKLGEYGAILFGADDRIFRCGAWPLHEVADPTGAGDSFLGAFLGELAAAGDTQPSFEALSQAVVTGTVAASFTCEAFSTAAIEAADAQAFAQRRQQFAEISRF